jgi:hypothetical protein
VRALHDVVRIQHSPIDELPLDPFPRIQLRFGVRREVTVLGREKHFVPRDDSVLHEASQGAADAPFRPLVAIVDRRVERIAPAGSEGGLHRALDRPVGRRIGTTDVRAETDRRDRQSRRGRPKVGRRDLRSASGESLRSFGRRSPRQPSHGPAWVARVKACAEGKISRYVPASERTVPRRKYGRMQKPIPPVPPERCRLCRLHRPCPAHPWPSAR